MGGAVNQPVGKVAVATALLGLAVVAPVHAVPHDLESDAYPPASVASINYTGSASDLTDPGLVSNTLEARRRHRNGGGSGSGGSSNGNSGGGAVSKIKNIFGGGSRTKTSAGAGSTATVGAAASTAAAPTTATLTSAAQKSTLSESQAPTTSTADSIGITSSSAVPSDTHEGSTSSSAAPTDTHEDLMSSKIAPTATNEPPTSSDTSLDTNNPSGQKTTNTKSVESDCLELAERCKHNDAGVHEDPTKFCAADVCKAETCQRAFTDGSTNSTVVCESRLTRGLASLPLSSSEMLTSDAHTSTVPDSTSYPLHSSKPPPTTTPHSSKPHSTTPPHKLLVRTAAGGAPLATTSPPYALGNSSHAYGSTGYAAGTGYGTTTDYATGSSYGTSPGYTTGTPYPQGNSTALSTYAASTFAASGARNDDGAYDRRDLHVEDHTTPTITVRETRSLTSSTLLGPSPSILASTTEADEDTPEPALFTLDM